MTVNYVCILKKEKIYRKDISGYSQHVQRIKTCKTPQYTVSFLGTNQFYYLLKDAASRGGVSGVGSVCVEWGAEGSSLNIYRSLSLFAMSCSLIGGCVSLSPYCILRFLLVDGATSKQFKVLICLSLSRTSNGAVFSMFISSYGCVLFRCVNRHYPLSFSNCKPKYRKSDDPAITVSTYYMLSIQI